MEFIYVEPCKDLKLREAVVDWVIEELEKDVNENRANIVCLVYGIGVEKPAALGQRVTVFSKTGGYDVVKALVLMNAVQGMSATSAKSGHGWLGGLPWWKRLVWRLVMLLPT